MSLSVEAGASTTSLQENLDKLTAHLTDEASVFVVSLDTDDVLYRKNITSLLNPASTLKILTAAAALKYLGPGYRFETEFYLSPERDLYIVGKGDPSLVIEELRIVAAEIASIGFKKIRNIIINDSYFDGYTSPGLPEDKKHYNSYTGALSLNFNRGVIRVSPGKGIGDPAKVVFDAGDTEIEINNKVTTSGRRTRTKIELLEPEVGKEDLFIVEGQIPQKSKTRYFKQHIFIPPLFVAGALKTLLEENGVTVTGKIWRGGKPNRAKLVLTHKSKPISEIGADMNKFSNNFIAEQLLKTLGARHVSEPGSSQKGVTVLKDYLKKLELNPARYTVVNGSGLSYDNRIDTVLLITVIRDMYHDQHLWPPFSDSLSIAGKDGTLRRRKSSKLLYKRLRAKTGSVDYVKTIAGIVPAANGETIAFAILLNGSKNIGQGRKLQTSILEEVAKFRR